MLESSSFGVLSFHFSYCIITSYLSKILVVWNLANDMNGNILTNNMNRKSELAITTR